MKRYRFVPGAIALAIALILMMDANLPQWLPAIFIIIAAILVIFASRGTVHFAKAVKAINSMDPEKKKTGVELMRKALKVGVSDENAVIAASVLLQNGDEEKAKETLEELSKSKERKVAGPALSSLSMYYWLQGDYEKAIGMCTKAKEIGYASRNLYVNLLTYYLAAGKTREFNDLLEEMGTSGASSPAIVDFIAVNEMLHGNWKQAGAYLYALCIEATPSFPDAYIHFAHVYMHYGDLANARKMLEEALDSEYARYSVYTKDYVNNLIRILSSEYECLPFLEAATKDNKAILKIANGKIPEYRKSDTAAKLLDILPGFPAEPDFRSVVKDEEIDDRDANTELTDADEEWLNRHSD